MHITHGRLANGDVYFTATISSVMDEYTAAAVANLIAVKIAERYVEEHYVDIAAKLNPVAIANVAVADAAKKIAEEIRTRPVILREKTTHIHNSLF